jgi:hypothetical protein
MLLAPPAVDRLLAIDNHDHVQCVCLFNEYINPSEGHTKALSKCPLQKCCGQLGSQATLRTLYMHCSNLQDEPALYRQHHHTCKIGCILGSPDPLNHPELYVESLCERGNLPTRCPEPGCKHAISRSLKSPKFIGGAHILHYSTKHALDTYTSKVGSSRTMPTTWQFLLR